MKVTDAMIDAAVDRYMEAQEAGLPEWQRLEEIACDLIEQKFLDDEL